MSSLHTHKHVKVHQDKEGKSEDAEDRGTFKRCALTASFLPPINTSSINTPASTQNHRSARHMTAMSFTSRTPQWLMQYVSSAVFIEPCGFYCYKMVPIDKK